MSKFFGEVPTRIWIALAVLLLVSIPAVSQLQQSGGGGSTVTLQAGANIAGKFGIDQTTPGTTNGVQVNAALPAGANIVGKFGIDQTTVGTTNAVSLAQLGSTAIATGNGTSGAGVQRVNIASDNTAFSVNATVAAALPAGTNVIGHVITDSGTINTIPKTACGNTLATGSTLAAVPTSSTLVTSAATACAVVIVLNNTNASATTVTVTDNTATPINDLLTFSIPGFSQVIQPLYGVSFNLGIKWAASGTGVTGAVVAYQ